MEVKAFIEILRPHNCFVAGLVGILGSIVALGHFPKIKTAVLIFAVVFLGCSAGNTINDYFDYEIDKINRPTRPLPRGAMSRKTAFWYAMLLFVVGLVLAYRLNIYAFILAVAAYSVLLIYAWKLKPLPIIGNIMVASLTGATPLYGAIAVGKIGLAGYLALCAFLVNLAREIMKDIEDIEGDKAKGAKTLPIVWGIKKSAYLASLFGIATVVASFLPLKVGIGIGYLPMIVVDGLILAAVFELLKNPMPKTAGKAQKKLKAAIYLAVFSFLLGSITTGVRL
ncbi:geranylgeranylglycerol-phosphate geranylgeranyltransferase [Thermococcus barophilus]|uniref:Digeranylgeranylglyceryl phosphate synthase n=1 Tax=Thermococcus barophilus (strain DSM 11836 / MP) TaxID=391623 RepID=F0LLE5_THEBM|nr:geranylgeranylglycerol-phosphate geranylgeranyltransferase [Thermococcus barophilus]ADT84974.1 (S)-2,3-di-O-geranylgeranylglyceryl phosphate synthase [Thermococcus barophilus MP]